MVVQHNLQAMNSNRMLGITEKTVSSSTEKLSSGYAINRAADNAAGLAISEKMRKQIRGLTQASTNAEDGISSVQTAEGALAEVQDMLQRMNELCVQAANGTNSSTDRQYIQDEIDQLVSEIDRVAETTKFNETYLLKGDETKGKRSTYITSYSLTYARNISTNASPSASKYKINYVGTNNLMIVSASILNSNSTTSLSATPVGHNKDITEFFVDNNASTLQLGTIDYGTSFNTKKYVAFVNAELNSNVATNAGTPAGTITIGGGDADLFIDTNQSGSTIRAAQDLFILNTETNMVIHKYAGDALTDYIKASNNTMEDKYRLVDIVDYDDSIATARTGSFGSHLGVNYNYTNHDYWTTSNLELDITTQNLYDASGAEVSSMRLDDFFDENGKYKGGLFTTAQARDVDEVFATDSAAKNVTSAISNNTATSISKYIQQLEQRVSEDLAFNLHVGSDSDRSNKIITQITTLNSIGLGVSKLSSKNIGIVDGTGDLATDAIDTISAAINMISRQRASLGAVQNRLEHTIKNLDNVVENTQSAESTIRDTDMATEMVKYSNANILQQAGQSMLAQANQSKQGITQLLQ